MRGKLCCKEYGGRAVRAADYADRRTLGACEAQSDSAEEGDEYAQLRRCAHEQALGVCKQRAEVGHCADSEEYKRWVDAGLNADVEEIKQSGACHNVTVAVIIGACLVEEGLPQLGVIQRVLAHADKVAQVREQAAEGYAAQEQGLELFDYAKVQKHEGNDYHDEVFPAAVGGYERGEAGLKRKLPESTENVHPLPPYAMTTRGAPVSTTAPFAATI